MLRRRHALQANKARARRSAPRVERLEGRELMTFDFKTALGLGATGGSGNIFAPYAVALDSAGDTYVTGAITGSVRLDPNSAALTSSHGGRDIVVAKYSPSGALLYAHTAGSAGDDTGFGIAVDPSGNAYVTGEFTGLVDFSTNGTPHTLSASNRGDVFVWKLDAAGNTAYAVQSIGLTGNLDTGYAIAVDAAGNAFIGGSYQTGINPSTGQPFAVAITFGSTTLADAATFAPFAAKVDPSGNFVWARSAIGAANAINEGKAIAIDGSDNVYLAGGFSGSANFNSAGSDIHTSAGNLDSFVQEFDANGNFLQAKTFGGPGNDTANGIAVDASRNIFVFGQYSGTANFNPNPGTPVNLTSQGFSGFYLSKLSPAGNLLFADDLGAPLANIQTNAGAGGVGLDSFGNAYVTGVYQNTAHIGSYTLPNTSGGLNSFVAQVSNAGKILQVKRLANAGNVTSQAIAVNAAGTIASGGTYDTAPTFGINHLPAALAGNTNGFVTTLTRRTPGDYFGDGKTDLAIYTTSNAVLAAAEPGVHGLVQQFGVAGHDNVPIAGDFNGDGKTDLAIYDRTNGFISVLFSGGAGGLFQQFGVGGHDSIPIAGDFDGDGKTDIAIYDRTNSILSVLYSSGTGGIYQQFGIAGHDSVPIAADFDGDGKTDMAIYDRTNDTLSALYTSGGGIIQQFGSIGHDNVPMAGDYDGDGRTDISIFDRTTATYSTLYSAGGGIVQQFGDASQGTRIRPSPTSFDPLLGSGSASPARVVAASGPVLISATPDLPALASGSRKKNA